MNKNHKYVHRRHSYHPMCTSPTCVNSSSIDKLNSIRSITLLEKIRSHLTHSYAELSSSFPLAFLYQVQQLPPPKESPHSWLGMGTGTDGMGFDIIIPLVNYKICIQKQLQFGDNFLSIDNRSKRLLKRNQKNNLIYYIYKLISGTSEYSFQYNYNRIVPITSCSVYTRNHTCPRKLSCKNWTSN